MARTVKRQQKAQDDWSYRAPPITVCRDGLLTERHYPRLCCTDMALVLGIAGSSHIACFSTALAASARSRPETSPPNYDIRRKREVPARGASTSYKLRAGFGCLARRRQNHHVRHRLLCRDWRFKHRASHDEQLSYISERSGTTNIICSRCSELWDGMIRISAYFWVSPWRAFCV